MIVDTSALVAVVFGEPEATRLARVLASTVASVSAVTVVEASIVVEARQGPSAKVDLDTLLTTANVRVVAVDERLALLAVQAWQRFGKGRHPAGLNLGDCFSYALAKESGEPLLYVGDDFTQTDIAHAPW